MDYFNNVSLATLLRCAYSFLGTLWSYSMPCSPCTCLCRPRIRVDLVLWFNIQYSRVTKYKLIQRRRSGVLDRQPNTNILACSMNLVDIYVCVCVWYVRIREDMINWYFMFFLLTKDSWPPSWCLSQNRMTLLIVKVVVSWSAFVQSTWTMTIIAFAGKCHYPSKSCLCVE
jgi:hypothetical protein